MSMKNEREQISPPSNIGISMMLVVFLVLCLYTFSAIALVQAQNEYNNAVRMSDIRTTYYEGVSACANDLHKLNSAALDDASPPLPVIEKSYPLDGDMLLVVTFTLVEREEGPYYHITDFRTTSTDDWSGNDKLNLLQ